MRKNFGAKAILYPMPVLIIGTYDENGKANAMNAAQGGISEETQISICVDDGHKTAKNVVKSGAFTVSIADADNVVACDYVGIASGNKEPNKIEKAGWHVTKSEFVNAPHKKYPQQRLLLWIHNNYIYLFLRQIRVQHLTY